MAQSSRGAKNVIYTALGKLKYASQVPKAVLGAAKSKIQKVKVDNALHRKLMRDFPEGVVGLENMAKISKTLSGHLKANSPQKAVEYARSQREKIRK